MISFTNENEFKTWLESLPESHGEERARQIAIWLASRSALRVMPLIFYSKLNQHATEASSLPFLRCLLISSAASIIPADEIEALASSAATLASSSPTVLHPSSDSAVSSASAAFSVTKDSANGESVLAACAAHNAISINFIGKKQIWGRLWIDAHHAAHKGFDTPLPLWAAVNPLRLSWDKLKADVPEGWEFWVHWYDAHLAGRPLNPEMMKEIALIDPEDWEKSDKHANKVIHEIWQKYEKTAPTTQDLKQQQIIEQSYTSQTEQSFSGSTISQKEIHTTREAIERNKATLPPTIDALIGFIALEIERLQKVNYRDDSHQEDCSKQISRYCAMLLALEEIHKTTIDIKDTVRDDDAEKIIPTWKLYCDKFASIPREKIDRIVPATVILGTATIAAQFGLPLIGASLGGFIMLPKERKEVMEMAKDLFNKTGKDT